MSVKTARMADVLHELGRAIDSAILTEDDLILWIGQRYEAAQVATANTREIPTNE